MGPRGDRHDLTVSQAEPRRPTSPCKVSDFHGTWSGQAFAVEFNAFNRVKCFCCQVAFPTMQAANHGNVLNHQQLRALTVASGHPTETHTLLCTNVTDHLFLSFPYGNCALVIVISACRISLATTSRKLADNGKRQDVDMPLFQHKVRRKIRDSGMCLYMDSHAPGAIKFKAFCSNSPRRK